MIDENGDGAVNFSSLGVDRVFYYPTAPDHVVAGDLPVVGDWNGDGRSKIGIFRHDGAWFLDTNGDGVLNTGDSIYQYTNTPGDVPVVGDWNHDGRTKTGIFRAGIWILDVNGDGVVNYGPNIGVDRVFQYSATAGDIPVVGDWNGDGRTKTGIYRSTGGASCSCPGLWVLDTNGDGVLDTGTGDLAFTYTAAVGDIPVVGDWDGSGKTKTGIYRGGLWILDKNGDGAVNVNAPGPDLVYLYSQSPGDVPIVGDWNGDGKTKTGIYRVGLWVLDYNGDGIVNFSNLGVDKFYSYSGSAGDIPVVGKWQPAPPAPPAPSISVSQVSANMQTTSGAPVDFTLSVTGLNGWTAPVIFSTTYFDAGVAGCIVFNGGCYASLSVPVPGTVTYRVNNFVTPTHYPAFFRVGASVLQGVAATLSIEVIQGVVQPDFQLSLPATLTVPANGSTVSSVIAEQQGNFQGQIALTSSSDVTFGQNIIPAPGSSPVTFQAAERFPGDTYTATIFGNGGHQQSVTVTVGPDPDIRVVFPGYRIYNDGTPFSLPLSCSNGICGLITDCSAGDPGVIINISQQMPNSLVLTFIASRSAQTGSHNVYCHATGIILRKAILVIFVFPTCTPPVVTILDSSSPGRKFDFVQRPGTGVLTGNSYSPNVFGSILSAVATTTGGTFSWSVDNTNMVQFVSASGATSPTAGGPSVFIQATELSDSAAGSGGRRATVRVDYTDSCSTTRASFSFVLTEDVTVIAYVDYAKTYSDVGNPSSPSYFNAADPALARDSGYQGIVSALGTEATCLVNLVGWGLAARTHMPATAYDFVLPITEESQRRYANFFFTSGTANSRGVYSPPLQMDAAVLLAHPEYFRVYNRFEAAYQIEPNGSIVITGLQRLHDQSGAGLTLEPCSGLQKLTMMGLIASSPPGELHAPYDGSFGVIGGNIVYRLNEGRVGDDGQAGNAYVNKRPGFADVFVGDYKTSAPYVWSVIQFDKAGSLQPLISGTSANLPASTSNNVAVYSTFIVYKQGQKTNLISLQTDVESFITQNSNYRYLGLQ